MKKYVVERTAEERGELVELTSKGECRARRLKRHPEGTRALLAADEGDADVAAAARARVSVGTVERLRQRFVEEGLECALSEKPRPGKARKLDGRREAHLLALACAEPPPGRARWTMQLLADKLVELGHVDTVCDETVRRTLKRGI